MIFVLHDSQSDCWVRKIDWDSELKKYSAEFTPTLDANIKHYPTQKSAQAAVKWIISVCGYDFPDTLEALPLLDPIMLDEPLRLPNDSEDVTKGNDIGSYREEADCLKCPYFLNTPVKTVEPDTPDLIPVTDKAEMTGWEVVESVGEKKRPPLMLRKKWIDTYTYAIKLPDGKLYFLPGDEVLAWERYYDECKAFVRQRIQKRRVKEGKDPDGLDEWKGGEKHNGVS